MRKVQGSLAYGLARLDILASSLLDLVYPSRCPICGRRSDRFSRSPICSTCWEDIRPYDGPACGICAKPLPSAHAGTCGECLKERPPYAKALSYGQYSGALKTAIHLLKFSPVKRLSRPLGALLSGMDLPGADIIVPVPLSLGGLRQRGFNQTLLLARAISRQRGIALDTGLLYKKKETPPQVSLSRRARMRNLKGAFGTRKKVGGGRLLLIDDVMTTGATAAECSRTLLRAGADEVYVATLARA